VVTDSSTHVPFSDLSIDAHMLFHFQSFSVREYHCDLPHTAGKIHADLERIWNEEELNEDLQDWDRMSELLKSKLPKRAPGRPSRRVKTKCWGKRRKSEHQANPSSPGSNPSAPGQIPGPGRCLRILVCVPELRDKRRWNALDVLVLALVECGCFDSVELKTAAGLSPGAKIPALAPLSKGRLILQGSLAPRRCTDHEITADGRQYLKQGSRDLISLASEFLAAARPPKDSNPPARPRETCNHAARVG
jgi:hypothetical protein